MAGRAQRGLFMVDTFDAGSVALIFTAEPMLELLDSTTTVS